MVARTKSEDPRVQQILARLTASEYEILRSVAHLEGITPNGFVQQTVSAELKRHSEDPHVLADIENRRSFSETRQGEVVKITEGRPRRRS